MPKHINFWYNQKCHFWEKQGATLREAFNLELFIAGSIDRRSGSQALFHQISESLRKAILLGRISVGTKLPSSRFLASELKVSRNTVMTAYEQLTAEGYLNSKRGSGSYRRRRTARRVCSRHGPRTKPPFGAGTANRAGCKTGGLDRRRFIKFFIRSE